MHKEICGKSEGTESFKDTGADDSIILKLPLEDLIAWK
jgi:hypothetical protein